MHTVLSIAGSDCSGGAGIQADLKTITAHRLYGMSVITALTAQNTMGVQRVLPIGADFVTAQLDSIFTDIYPDSVKIGMIPDLSVAQAIVACLRRFEARNIVIDPVLSSSSGQALSHTDSLPFLWQHLFPLARLITPNLPEMEILCGFPISSREDMVQGAQTFYSLLHVPILVKGGHLVHDEAADLLYDGHEVHWFSHTRLQNPNTHGTGCTLSSAIACNLANGLSLKDSVAQAKNYLTGAIRAGLSLGHGRGPLNHMYKDTSL